jgi:hypothetical protein
MSSFGRFTPAIGGVVETLSYASPTLTLTQSVGTTPLTATIPSGGISGSGTTNNLPKFTASTIVGNSKFFDDGTNQGTETTTAVNRFIMSANASIAKIFSFRSANLPRWAFRVDGTESGANAGADFAIRRYNDAGTFIDAPLSFSRATGAATFSQGLSLSNATAPASGIEFPATQVAGASANNLDDYEEGTWTLGVSFGGASTGITYSQNSGLYTKIGRQVTVSGIVTLTNKGTSTGIARLTGLPFTIGNSIGNQSVPQIWLQNITFLNQFVSESQNNSTNIYIEQASNLGVVTILTDANFSNTSTILITYTYFV